MRLVAVVEYDGTEFAGFQLQAHRCQPPRTVQAELERAIAAAGGHPVRIVGSGRTDAGVHALGQVVHFDTTAPLAEDLPQLLRAINAHLPADVSIHTLRTVSPEFHARFSATGRTYRYRIMNHPTPSPLHRRYAHHVRRPLSLERMSEAAAHLLGTHDFVAFAAQEGASPTRRRVFRAVVSQTWARGAGIWQTDHVDAYRCTEAGDLEQSAAAWPRAGALRFIEIEIEADAFLRQMMRRIAGTLVRIGTGRLDPGAIEGIVASGNKARAGPAAPARGLFLECVRYDGQTGVIDGGQAAF